MGKTDPPHVGTYVLKTGSHTGSATFRVGDFRGFSKSMLFKFFIRSGGGLLLITGIAKVISASGKQAILYSHDPILGFTYRYVFILLGLVEISIALYCFLGTRRLLQAGILGWLSACFFLYRTELGWLKYARPCPCLGSLTAALAIPERTADLILIAVLFYMLIGSCIAFLTLAENTKPPLNHTCD